GPALWVAVEQWPAVKVAVSFTDTSPPASLPEALRRDVTVDEGRMLLVRGRLEISGPTTARRIAAELGMELSGVQIALEQLELAGVVLRGRFTTAVAASLRDADASFGETRLRVDELEWCERRLLARIHR